RLHSRHARPVAGGGQGDRPPGPGAGGNRRQGVCAGQRPLRWQATASGHRPRTGAAAQGAARRRAGGLTRPGHVAHRDARPASHQPRPRHHHHHQPALPRPRPHLRQATDRPPQRRTGLRRGHRRRGRGDLPGHLWPVGDTRRPPRGRRAVTTEAVAPTAPIRPPAPRRAWTIALPLLVGVGIGVAGALTARIAFGAVWAVIIAAGALLGLCLGKAELGTVARSALAVGLGASALLSFLVMPDPPEAVDVLLALSFSVACAPAAVASAVILRRRRARQSTVFSTAIAWLIGGAFALPATETIGVLVPLNSLRRGAEP